MHPDLAGLFDADSVTRRYGHRGVATPEAYAAEGWCSERDPNPLFDSAFYRAQVSAAEAASLSRPSITASMAPRSGSIPVRCSAPAPI